MTRTRFWFPTRQAAKRAFWRLVSMDLFSRTRRPIMSQTRMSNAIKLFGSDGHRPTDIPPSSRPTMDTKPVGDRAQWKHDPFDPVVSGSTRCGLGARDMNGGG